MKRRKVLGILGGAAIAWPFAIRAEDWERDRVYRLGFLLPTPRQDPVVAALFDELRSNGLVEGQNLLVIGNGFGVAYDRVPSLAASVIAASPDVIVTGPELPIRTLQKLTQTIPLVGMTEDMVGEGLVASLARPGNVTKPAHLEQLEEAARNRGVEALVRGVAKRDEVMPAIKDVQAAGAQAINFLATPMFSVDAAAFIAQVRALRLASVYQWPEDADDGALIAYGPRYAEMYRLRARLVMKVLRGTKPADIPVEQPTKFELVFNLKTAKAIGIDVPNSQLLRADKVIE